MAETIGLTGVVTKQEAAVMRALNRANAEGTHEKFLAIVAHPAFVGGVCGGNHGERYQVEIGTCSCLAGANGMTCKHSVALADRLGLMDQLVPSFYERVILPAPNGQAAA
jgi:hypothetical protein